MIDTDAYRCAGLGLSDHRCIKLKTQEVHRRRFHFVLANQIFIGDGKDFGASGNLYPDSVLDAFEQPQHTATLGFIGIFNLHRGFEITAIGRQRHIGRQLMCDAVFLEDFLDTQHFLHLISNQQFVFKHQHQVLAEKNTADFLLRHDFGTHRRAGFGVGFKRHQGFAGNAHFFNSIRRRCITVSRGVV